MFAQKSLFAYALDLLFWIVFVWLVCFLLLQGSIRGAIAAGIFAGAAGVLLIRAYREKLLYMERKRREEIRTDLILERILLMPETEAEQLPDAGTLVRKVQASLDDMLPHVRNGQSELWLCGNVDPKVRQFLDSSGKDVILHEKTETANRFQSLVSEREIEEALDKQMQKKKRAGKILAALRQLRPNRFTVLGIVLMAGSFITAYKLWFRMTATVSFFIGSMLYSKRMIEYAVRNQQNRKAT